MKKFLSIILAILTVFTFTACSKDNDNQYKGDTICYEFKYLLKDYTSYDNGSKYEWGEVFDGKRLSDKYAKFILKDDYTAEVWWKNVKYTGRWRLIDDETKIIFDEDKKSVSIEVKTTNKGCSQTSYEYYIIDYSTSPDTKICLAKNII